MRPYLMISAGRASRAGRMQAECKQSRQSMRAGEVRVHTTGVYTVGTAHDLCQYTQFILMAHSRTRTTDQKKPQLSNHMPEMPEANSRSGSVLRLSVSISTHRGW